MAKFIAIILLTISTSVYSLERTKYHVVQQTGSYSGMFTLGLGYKTAFYTPEILFGYVPKKFGGEELFSFSIKHNIHYNQSSLLVILHS